MTNRIRINSVTALSCAAFLAGCMGGDGLVSRSGPSFFGGNDAGAVQASAPTAALDANLQDGTQSPIIEGLLNRRSVLGSGSFSKVSDAVLAANTRAAEADLRAATLRSEARASNWLPTIGPQVSLTSLGAVVTSMVVEQVLFDNGRKKAERDYAQADVEVAAVALAQDTNDRVLSALELYLDAQTSNARADVNQAALERMRRFEYVMSERVRGGVSSGVDHQIVRQKLEQMVSDMQSDREAAGSAMSELGAMSAVALSGLGGLSSVGTDGPGAQPLTVMKAQAEAARAEAEAIAARAGFLPSLTLSGNAGSGGSSAGLNVGSANGIGFGMGASLEAAAAQQAAASARVGQVREDANRSLRALEGEIASLQRQATQAETLAQQASNNYDIFAEQQRAGHRSVPEVVGIFETKVRSEREAASLRFEVARMQLRRAAIMGTLVNGEQI